MLDILRSTCPFPTISPEGDLKDGLNVAQPKKCLKCVAKSCRSLFAAANSDGLRHAVCEHSYSVMRLPTRHGPMLINGVYVPFQNTVMDAPTRKSNRSQKVTWEQAQGYARLIAAAEQRIQTEIGRQVKDAVAGLHDIKTAVSVVFRHAESIIYSLPGYDDGERIESADPALKALLKSVNLLNSRLNLASIVANPDSAKYGQPRRTPVYKVFHLMARLFEAEAARRNVRIRMAGESYDHAQLRDSFETIPLILIDNAVKYATAGSEIVVRVNDTSRPMEPCTATVESIGPVIPLEYRAAIFERGFRAPQAKAAVSSGSGLGLYIAKIVADANNCKLQYSARVFRGGAEDGANCFTVTVGTL
jgi:signal transduction histidine kinase